MAMSDLDLEARDRQSFAINVSLAVLTALAGMGLMLTIALLPLGLIVFFAGLIWLGLVLLLGRANRLRESQHSPGEEKSLPPLP